jgi:hypothetical protein
MISLPRSPFRVVYFLFASKASRDSSIENVGTLSLFSDILPCDVR